MRALEKVCGRNGTELSLGWVFSVTVDMTGNAHNPYWNAWVGIWLLFPTPCSCSCTLWQVAGDVFSTLAPASIWEIYLSNEWKWNILPFKNRNQYRVFPNRLLHKICFEKQSYSKRERDLDPLIASSNDYNGRVGQAKANSLIWGSH